MGEVPVHRLRPNETVWTPPHVVFLDTETAWHDEGPDEVHELRLWVGCRVDRRKQRKTQAPVSWGWGTSPDDLARWLTACTRGRPCLWVYAHNLNFDLVTTRLPFTMTERGWRVTDFSVRSTAPWIRFRRGSHTVTVVDSWAWLPTTLASLASLAGGHKADLPDNDDGAEPWWARCAGDVDILARAVLQLMAWWDTERLGRWTISGAGSGWNAMRHHETSERHVIDCDPGLVAQDRMAVRGGRRDAQVVRSETGGPWVELDLVAAYPTVARELPLPVKRAWCVDRLDVDDRWLTSRFYSPVCEATIRCSEPRYALRWRGVTWYPVGEFRTVLAGPELAEAAARGELVSVGAGQVHKLGFALRPWATWVLDPSRRGTVEVPPVARVATKAWGRSVLGKFAARGHESERLDGPAKDGWSITDAWDRRTNTRAAEVSMAGQAWWVTYDTETENNYPAVLAFVESHVRVRLGRVLDVLGSAWWTCDTDGLLVDMADWPDWHRKGLVRIGYRGRDAMGAAGALCDALAPLVAPLVLRPKRAHASLAVLGPQHYRVGDELHYSGVRRDAVETEPGRFVARDWPKLKWQMEHSAPGVYTRPLRAMTFTGPLVHRWVGADGRCWPVEFRLSPAGVNELVPWPECRWARAGVELAGAQYRPLEALVS